MSIPSHFRPSSSVLKNSRGAQTTSSTPARHLQASPNSRIRLDRARRDPEYAFRGTDPERMSLPGHPREFFNALLDVRRDHEEQERESDEEPDDDDEEDAQFLELATGEHGYLRK